MADINAIQITAHISEDGYLIGAERADCPGAQTDRFWHHGGTGEQCKPCRIETWLITVFPVEAAQSFIQQGTSEQVYRDGYEAYGALRRAGILATGAVRS